MELRPKQTHEPILNEAYNLLKNEPGTVAMARTEDPDSATSQFFINLDENLFLNHYRPDPDYYGYCVFGRVVQGWDVVQRIANVPTGPVESFPSDVPLKPIMIETVRVVSAPPNLSPSPK
jgi:cyclophilin family peptidyl-prolyl cis-trans isomerase